MSLFARVSFGRRVVAAFKNQEKPIFPLVSPRELDVVEGINLPLKMFRNLISFPPIPFSSGERERERDKKVWSENWETGCVELFKKVLVAEVGETFDFSPDPRKTGRYHYFEAERVSQGRAFYGSIHFYGGKKRIDPRQEGRKWPQRS